MHVLFYLNIIMHIYFTLDIEVEFSSSSYIGSESLKGVPVTLVITKGTINDGEEIVVNIVATSHSPVSAEGIYLYVIVVNMHVCATTYVYA